MIQRCLAIFTNSLRQAIRSIAILLHAVPSSVHRDGQVARAAPQSESEVSSWFPPAKRLSSSYGVLRTPPIASRKQVDGAGLDGVACRGAPFLSVVWRAEGILQAPKRSYFPERRPRTASPAP